MLEHLNLHTKVRRIGYLKLLVQQYFEKDFAPINSFDQYFEKIAGTPEIKQQLDNYSFYAKLDNPQNLIFGALYPLFSLTSLWGLSIVCKQLADIVSVISSRAQEIECDQFAVKMNGINNFLKQADYYDASQYFQNRKKSLWLNIKYLFTDTHPSWSKRKLSAIKFNRQYRSLSESLILSHDQ